MLVLKVRLYMGVSLCSLHMASGFIGRAGSEMNIEYILPSDVLVATALVEGRNGLGGATARDRCNQGLLLC